MNIISKKVIHTIELDGVKFKRLSKNEWQYGSDASPDDELSNLEAELLEEQFQEAVKELKFITNDFK